MVEDWDLAEENFIHEKLPRNYGKIFYHPPKLI